MRSPNPNSSAAQQNLATAAGGTQARAGAEAPGRERRLMVRAVLWAMGAVASFYIYAIWIGGGEPTYDVPVQAFDPRHPIAGQYLAFRYRWPLLNGLPGDGSALTMPAPEDALACVCLPSAREFAETGVALRCGCGPESATPDGYATRIDPQTAYGEGRFFIPEESAAELGLLLSDGRAAIRLKVGPMGDAIPVELLIDGAPWRTALQTRQRSPEPTMQRREPTDASLSPTPPSPGGP